MGNSKDVLKIVLASVENADNKSDNDVLICGCLDAFVQEIDANWLYHIDSVHFRSHDLQEHPIVQTRCSFSTMIKFMKPMK